MYIETANNLRELYGFPVGRAKEKVLGELEEHSIRFIRHSPFVVIASRASTGSLDCSPRGGKPGFVKVRDEKRVLIPDSKGNNRLDSLINIVETGYCGCLFLIPGVDETLRLNGSAKISVNAAHLALFADEKNPPKSCIELNIEEVFLHCAKSLMRSKLWAIESQVERTVLPTIGKMLSDQLGLNEEPESQDDMIARYMRDL